MRNRHVCPKCDHREIVHFPQLEANHAPVCVETQIGLWRQGGIGRFEAYVCGKCGFAELYMLDVESARASVKSAEVLKGPPAEPFR
jgi:predicted nucleic-acid-binding Zn-ribbon protein